MKELEHRYNTIKSSIMEQIDKEHISPHSKLYFWLRALVAVTGILVLCSLIVYMVSFMLFTLSRSGILFLSPFGFFGIFSILNDLPWKLVLLSVFALIGLLMLTKNTFSVYRLPLMYLFLFAIGFVGVTGLIVAKTRMHPFILEHFDKRPPGDQFRAMSHGVRPEAHNITTGVLLATTTEKGFLITLHDGSRVEVKTNGATKYFTKDIFSLGDEMLVFGERRQGVIFAGAVREVERREAEDLER